MGTGPRMLCCMCGKPSLDATEDSLAFNLVLEVHHRIRVRRRHLHRQGLRHRGTTRPGPRTAGLSRRSLPRAMHWLGAYSPTCACCPPVVFIVSVIGMAGEGCRTSCRAERTAGNSRSKRSPRRLRPFLPSTARRLPRARTAGGQSRRRGERLEAPLPDSPCAALAFLLEAVSSRHLPGLVVAGCVHAN